MTAQTHRLWRQAELLGKHEAGHHIAARSLGFNVGDISITLRLDGSHQGHAEVILWRPLETMPQVESFLESRIIILYAGAAAEALANGSVNSPAACKLLQEGGAMTDWARARDLIQLLRNLKYPGDSNSEEAQDSLNRLNDQLWEKAIGLVESHAVTIERLGTLLVSKIVLGSTSHIGKDEIESVSGILEIGVVP